jgi:hypothetical protein
MIHIIMLDILILLKNKLLNTIQMNTKEDLIEKNFTKLSLLAKKNFN